MQIPPLIFFPHVYLLKEFTQQNLFSLKYFHAGNQSYISEKCFFSKLTFILTFTTKKVVDMHKDNIPITKYIAS